MFFALIAFALLGVQPIDMVDPFVGTSSKGNTYPGVSRPFGFVQVSPDSGTADWGHCSGYRNEDRTLLGFSHTHASGTGGTGLGDVLLQPLRGSCTDPLFRERKSDEVAHPGYYAVTYEKTGIRIELTATSHAALHRYTFLKGGAGHVLVDLKHGISQLAGSADTTRFLRECEVAVADDRRTITGHRKVRDFMAHEVAFKVVFDRPFKAARRLPPAGPKDAGVRFLCDFDVTVGDVVRVKVALSSVDVDGASRNLAAEIPDWDFDRVREACAAAWRERLGRVELPGADDRTMRNFYSSLYHFYLYPTQMADVDGRYRNVGKVGKLSSNVFYSGLSLWDTFRAAFPLVTILEPDIMQDVVDSMLAQQKIKGYLPIWSMFGGENQCMVGNHGVPVVVDAWMKGLWKGNDEVLLSAVTNSLRGICRRRKEDWHYLDSLGYYPYDGTLQRDSRGRQESVSRLLESCYDDACASRLAAALGKGDVARYFAHRSMNWTNVFDRTTGFMRGRNLKGEWRAPFDPFELGHTLGAGGDYTECNAWQYTWHVMQHPRELIDSFGGNTAFVRKLDGLFLSPDDGRQRDVTHKIGQYAHGNEPVHHVVYFYLFAGRPDRTEELVREVCETCYAPNPDGLCGNDDCGQMSAWYVFSVLGFYPFDPCGGEYVIGAPQVPKAILHLTNGRSFTVTAKNFSRQNKYVKSVTLNGKPVTSRSIRHSDIVKGGELAFEMGISQCKGIRP